MIILTKIAAYRKEEENINSSAFWNNETNIKLYINDYLKLLNLQYSWVYKNTED